MGRPITKLVTGKEVLLPKHLFDRGDKLYIGTKTIKKMRVDVRISYHIFMAQRARMGVDYKFREFCYWFVKNLKRKSWVYPNVGRLDHSKGYSFPNIEMQEQVANIQERNLRLGNPGKSHRKILAVINGKKLTFNSKRDAAKYFGVSEKTVYNHSQGRTNQHFKFGPKTGRAVRFYWND